MRDAGNGHLTTPEDRLSLRQEPLNLICVGASAGGLDAIQRFFRPVPTDCPFAFVVIQHLSSHHDSMLVQLLGREAALPIAEVRADMPIERGHIYVIPPGSNIKIQGTLATNGSPSEGRVQEGDLTFALVQKAVEPALNLPIDLFFKSIAEAAGDRAIGVVLSGTGSDGSRGLRAIKEAGGFILVQDPATAAFDGMPNMAMGTGLVDLVLPVEEMSREIYRHVDSHLEDVGGLEAVLVKDEQLFEAVLELLRRGSGVNLDGYKRATLRRRIARRIKIVGCESVEAYLRLLDENAEELARLQGDLFIGVTEFFRDPQAWELLKQEILVPLFEGHSDNPIKAWCVGCSTGEEAYTLAMVLDECAQAVGSTRDVKIYGTDIDQRYVTIARRGQYRRAALAGVNEERLERYFRPVGDEYQVRPGLRGRVVFSTHDALGAPPILGTDIVLCRNLMIYLAPSAQKRLIATLNYSLRVGGVAFLGPSESLTGFEDRFSVLDRRWRIYRNVVRGRPGYRGAVYALGRGSPDEEFQQRRKADADAARPSLKVRMLDVLTQAMDTCCILVDSEFRILATHGPYTAFIKLPESGFSTQLRKMVPPELLAPITMVVRRALREKRASHAPVTVDRDGKAERIELTAETMKPTNQVNTAVLLIMRKIQSQTVLPTASKMDVGQKEYVAELESELETTRFSLQTSLAELETANEEMQSTNEELMSTVEELQSANEELQSINEELHTLNAEHKIKIDELEALNADMENLLRSTDIGTIFLDEDLRIREFTPAVREQFHLISRDVGRPINHFAATWQGRNGEDLAKVAEAVMGSGKKQIFETRGENGSWFQVRVLPYRDVNDVIGGVVATFHDISDLRAMQEELAAHGETMRRVLEGTLAGYWDRNLLSSTEHLSPMFKQMLGYEDHELENSTETWQRLIHPDDLRTVQQNFRKHVESRGQVPFDNQVRYQHKDGSLVWMWSRGLVTEWTKEGEPARMVGSHVDITALKQAQAALEERANESRRFAYLVSHDLREPLNTISNYMTLILEDRDGPTDEYVSYAKDAADRLKEMISAFLDYARLRKDAVQLELLDMNQIAADLNSDLGSVIGENDGVLEVGPLPQVLGSKVHVRQLMQNLLENAAKFRSPERALRIIVRGAREPATARTRIWIEDNGVGIEPDSQDLIFEMFQRAHARSQYPGLGIGLSIAHRIAELHGSELEVQSTPGLGSAFTFTLPAPEETE